MNDYTPIAVVGIGCRFSGGAHDTETLWSILEEGQNTWTDVPEDRFAWKSFDHPAHDATSGFRHRGGHFLSGDVAAFDADFFGISSSEAQAMDPQQRHALEVAHEAFENAGIPLETVKGSDTGVYVATFNHDYENLAYKDTPSMPKYSMTGLGSAIVSNRISYLFDLKGPSMTIDTGCSGSLVALHQACQSLRLRESRCALVGGTNLILSPDTMIPMHKLHFLNSAGRSFSFDEMGSGYGRGEGVVMLVLKPLDLALENHDPIRGVIRATAVGQDGKTRGITAPNTEAQQTLIKCAYRLAGLDPADTPYVEAHGTGTVKGDTAEVQALHDVFSRRSEACPTLTVGSLKANFGHTEASSGLAGVVKAILTLEKDMIPGTPTVRNLRQSLVPFMDTISISSSNQPWPQNAVMRISVNSFAYGGTNAHAIIDAASEVGRIDSGIKNDYHRVSRRMTQPSRSSSSSLTDSEPWSLVPTPRSPSIFGTVQDYSPSQATDVECAKLHILTAKTREALLANITRMYDWVQRKSPCQLSIQNLAYTLCDRRSLMQWRYAFVCSNRDQLLSALARLQQPCARMVEHYETVFVFSGQGGQWYAMGRELMDTDVFRSSLQTSNGILKDLGCPWSLIDELIRSKETSRVSDCEVGQPILTAIQLALIQLLSHLDVNPRIVVGHSSGEIAAAFAAGAVDHRSALKIAYHRGQAARKAREVRDCTGAMLAVGLGENKIGPYMRQVRDGKAVVACKNSESSITISGDLTAINQLVAILKRQAPHVFVKKLNVDIAYHSHHMTCVAEAYKLAISDIVYSSPNPSVTFISSVSGEVKIRDFGASYWAANMLSKVDFCGAMKEVYNQIKIKYPNGRARVACGVIEIGPGKALSSYTKELFDGIERENLIYSYQSVLIREQNAHRTLLEAMGQRLQLGGNTAKSRLNDLTSIYPQTKPEVLTDLPTYAWNRSRSYWSESRAARQHLSRAHPYHDLCGVRNHYDTVLEPQWRHIVSVERLPWLRDHLVDGVIVFPGAGYLAMAIQAKAQIMQERHCDAKTDSYCLEQVSFSNLLQIPDSEDEVEVRLTLTVLDPAAEPKDDQWEEFRISSIRSDGVTAHHCSGRIKAESRSTLKQSEVGNRNKLSQIEPLALSTDQAQRTYQKWDPEAIYSAHNLRGHHWGPSFARIQQFNASEHAVFGTISVPDIAKLMPQNFMQPHTIHPSTLDALIHSTLLLFSRSCNKSIMFPISIARMVLRADIPREPGDQMAFSAQINPKDSGEIAMDIDATSINGKKAYLSIRGGCVRGTENTESIITYLPAKESLIHELRWKSDISLSMNNAKYSNFAACEPELANKAKYMTENLNDMTAELMTTALSQIAEAKIKPHHKQYFQWMKELVQASPTVKPLATSSSDCNTSVEGQTLSALSKNLELILAGHTEAMSVYIDNNLLNRLYFEDWSAKQLLKGLLECLDLVTFKAPGIKMLEIGAGTGSVTRSILESLCTSNSRAISQYDFTDISSGFFEDSRNLLQQWDKIVRHKVLDISKDPIEQGFEAYSYDVVFAYNALHVTDSVDVAISNARKLLKPDGKLILLEMTRLHPFINAIYGLLPGWYMKRKDGRQGAPLLCIEQWSERLQKNRFSDLELIQHDFHGPPQRTSLMVARALSSDATVEEEINLHLVVCGAQEKYSSIQTALMKQRLPGDCNVSLAPSVVKAMQGGIAAFVSTSGKMVVNENMSVSGADGMVWITYETQHNPPQSLYHTTTSRHSNGGQLPVITIQIASALSTNHSRYINDIHRIIKNSFGNNRSTGLLETHYVLDGDRVLIPRITTPQTSESVRPPTCKPPMDVSDTQGLSSGEIEIEVFAHESLSSCALHRIDCKQKAYAGVVTSADKAYPHILRIGDQVCTWGDYGDTGRILVPAPRVIRVPVSMDIETTASLPLLLSTAYYAMTRSIHPKKSTKILIKGKHSILGRACVQIANHFNFDLIASEHGRPSRKLYTSIEIESKPKNEDSVDLIVLAAGTIDMQTILKLKPFGTFVNLTGSCPLMLLTSKKPVNCVRVDVESMMNYEPEIIDEMMTELMPLFERQELESIFDETLLLNTKAHSSTTSLTSDVVNGDMSRNDMNISNQFAKGDIGLSTESTVVIVGQSIDLIVRCYDLLSSVGITHVAIIPDKPMSVASQRDVIAGIYMRNMKSKIRLLPHVPRGFENRHIRHEISDWPLVKGLIFLGGHKDSQLIQDFVDLVFLVEFRSLENLIGQEDGPSYFNGGIVSDVAQLSIYNSFDISPADSESSWSSVGFEEFRHMFSTMLVDMIEDRRSRQVVVEGPSGIPHRARDSTLMCHLTARAASKALADVPEIVKTTVLQPAKCKSLEDTTSFLEAQDVVKLTLFEKIVSLTSIDADETGGNTSTPIENLGLDSFMRFRLRNWIFGTFKAVIEPDEIADAPSIDYLIRQILERTSFTSWKSNQAEVCNGSEGVSEPEPVILPSVVPLPTQPLPKIEDTLQAYLDAVRPFCSPEELARTETEIQKFQAPASIANKVQQRLQNLVSNPAIENWLSHLYMERRYLALRSPLVAHQTYFGTHPFGPVHQSQAERAALLTITALQFREKCHNNTLEPQSLAGKAVDPASYKWIFNTCRKPQIGKDELIEHDGNENNHIVIMRQGHAFAVTLKEGDQLVSLPTLEAVFSSIIELPLKNSRLGILTADGRDSWAKNRTELLEFDPVNKISIDIIDRAMFIVCLDDESPETPVDRFRQFLFANSTNRWYDKTFQFVVCRNGTSGSVMEHAALDGVAVSPLHDAINAAILEYRRDESSNAAASRISKSVVATPLPIHVPSSISTLLWPLCQSLKSRSENYTFTHLTIPVLSSKFITTQKLPLQSALQLAIQLASTRFFGHPLPASETVSLAHFRLGRVDVNAIVGTAMLNFLTTCSKSVNPTSPLRKLAVEATREHMRSLTRVHMGRGYNRHLLAMEWMLDDMALEQRPTFFQDPSYVKSKPGKVLTSTFSTGWLEGGFVYPVPEGVLVYFEPLEECVRYSIFGNGVDAGRFGRELERASEEVHNILAFNG